MAVVKCKVEWESDGWSYVVLKDVNQLRYVKIPTRIIVCDNDDRYIYVDIVKEKGKSYKCKLKDVRYKEYYFIEFSISKDHFIKDEKLEANTKFLYDVWCKEVGCV